MTAPIGGEAGSGGATSMFRMLAREEQKKLAKLKAEGGSSAQIKATEKRLEHLLSRMQSTPTKEKKKGVDAEATMTSSSVCDWCGKVSERRVKTGAVVSIFCSSECQRSGWSRHLERVRQAKKSETEWEEVERAAEAQDEQWRKETIAQMADEKEYDLDFLGVVRGKCLETGCIGFVQTRGAPRNIKPKYQTDGKLQECGVWSWNRSDHMACRRCGAPSTQHEDLTQQFVDENKRLKAIAKQTPKKPKSLSTKAKLSSPLTSTTPKIPFVSTDDDDETPVNIVSAAHSSSKPSLPYSRDQLSAFSIKELKLLCVRASVDISGFVDKADIVQALYASSSLVQSSNFPSP